MKTKKVAPKRSQISTQRVVGKMEVRREPTYSTLTLGAGALSGIRATFFSASQGGTVTDIQTDIVTPGQLPYPQRFTVSALRFACNISNPKDYDFLVKLFKTSYIRFFVGSKDYLIVPLQLLASGVSGTFYGGKADGSKAKIISQAGSASRNGYELALNKTITIGSKENFGVEIQSSISHTLVSSAVLRMYLEGTKFVEVR